MQHIALSRAARETLYLALAGVVRDVCFDLNYLSLPGTIKDLLNDNRAKARAKGTFFLKDRRFLFGVSGGALSRRPGEWPT